MYTGAKYAWGWLKQLTTMEEQKFSSSLEPMDPRNKDDHQKSRLFWTLSDLVSVALCFQIDIIYLCDMGYMLKNDRNPGFLQIMVMYATWGPALIYMEIFLGQYVQHGCLYLKNMSPLTCSTIGYVMLLTMYCYSVATVDRLADSYMFIFRSFGSELPWMVCPKGSTPATCIDRALLVQCYLENKRDDCYPELGPELLSSRIYYKATHTSLANRTALLLFAWLTIYIALKQTFSGTRVMAKRLLLFMLVLFLCLLTPLMVYVGRGLSVVPFFSLRQGAVLSLQTWITAFKNFLRDHATVRGGWQLIGCHIKPGPMAANLTIYSCGLSYLVTVFSQIFSTGILGVLIFYMKITRVDEELYFANYAKLFNFYPFALGLLQVRQVWSLVFFVLVTFSSISYMVVNMAILEESMYDEFPVMLRYRGYVKVSLCILGFLISIVSNLLTGSNSYEDAVTLQVGRLLTKVVILILTFSVGYIYGIERFSDDMNFLNGHQPTTYWKICWKILPFGILIFTGSDMIDIDFSRNDLTQTTANIVYVTLLILVLLRLLYQIIMSIKARNVAGMLFQATPIWGPPLPEDHRLRNTYNPREETKYWRKDNLCTHHCLLNKDFIISVIYREVDSRTDKRQDNDTPQEDFTAVPGHSRQNQVVIAIDKVSSAQLETFEKQLKQRVKFLEQIEEKEVNLHHGQSEVPDTVMATRSMEELDHRIEQMIKEADRRAELEGRTNAAGVQKTSSKTKQRRLPTFVPKETPRPKKTPKAIPTANRKDAKDTDGAKFHTFAVAVPHFILEPSGHPTLAKSTQETENLESSQTPLFQAVFGSQPTSSKVLQRQPALKPGLEMKEPCLSIWTPLLDTPQPTASSKVSQSSSSTSTASREAHFPLPAFPVNQHLSSESPGSSDTSLELSVLSHDPVLREILRSVGNPRSPDSPKLEKKGIGRKAPRIEEEESVVDIDRAVQIRIENLLRGVKNPGRSTDQCPSGSSAVARAKNVSRVARRQYRYPKTCEQVRGTSQNSAYLSKAKNKLSNQAQATGWVASKISALEKRIANRMTRRSTSSKITTHPQTYDKSDK